MNVEIEDKPTINPDALYDALETGWLLGYRSDASTEKMQKKSIMNRVYRIPESELPRTPTGPRGGHTMFMGRDILKFIEQRRRHP